MVRSFEIGDIVICKNKHQHFWPGRVTDKKENGQELLVSFISGSSGRPHQKVWRPSNEFVCFKASGTLPQFFNPSLTKAYQSAQEIFLKDPVHKRATIRIEKIKVRGRPKLFNMTTTTKICSTLKNQIRESKAKTKEKKINHIRLKFSSSTSFKKIIIYQVFFINYCNLKIIKLELLFVFHKLMRDTLLRFVTKMEQSDTIRVFFYYKNNICLGFFADSVTLVHCFVTQPILSKHNKFTSNSLISCAFRQKVKNNFEIINVYFHYNNTLILNTFQKKIFNVSNNKSFLINLMCYNIVTLNVFSLGLVTVVCPINFSTNKYAAFSTILLRSGDIESNPGPKFNVISFNINGAFNDSRKQKRVINKLHRTPNVIACIQETHLTASDEFALNARWTNSFIASHNTNASAGVIILYRENDWDKIIEKGTIIEGRGCYLAAKTQLSKILFVNIYAPNDPIHSRNFYSNLKDKLDDLSRKFYDYEMCICGDFNLSISSTDNINRQGSNAFQNSIEYLSEINSIYGLADCRLFSENKCMPTWKRADKASRLDYIFCSLQLFNYVNSYDHDWSFDKSDHCAVKISLDIPSDIINGRGYYKINMQLLNIPECYTRISEHISGIRDCLCDHWDPHKIWEYYKLEIRNIFIACGSELASEHKNELKNTELEYNRIIRAHNDKLINPNSVKASINDLEEAIVVLDEKLDMLRKVEADKLLFRSKLTYLQNGEKCSKHFLNTLKRKEKRILIPSVRINDKIVKGSELGPEIKNYYESLYSKNSDVLNGDFKCDIDANFKLSDQQSSRLDEPITLNELFETLRSCKDSSPGLDAIPYSLYKAFWRVLGPPMLRSWEHSIATGKLSPDQRHSVITLLQKPGKPIGSIDNLRPINLSNCDIKLITKTLTKRVVQNKNIFSNTQTAYIPGRILSDNTLAIQSIIDSCDERDVEGYLISLDARKAFDSVDHDFMYKVLAKFNFSNKFIDLVKILYNDLTADVMVNGVRYGMFKLLRGVKQGDSLSCILFILCMEILLTNIKNNNCIRGIEINEQKIKGFIYADDTSPTVADKNSIQKVFMNMHTLVRSVALS